MQRLEEFDITSPDKIAIIDGPITITYHELSELTDKISNHILALTASNRHNNKCIVVESTRTWESVALMLGILKANFFFVFIDDTHPEEKKKKLKEACNPILIINSLNNLLIQQTLVKSSTIEKNDTDLCYAYFTSGSTAQPKCALFDHKRAMSFITWSKHVFKINSEDVVASLSSFSFDISIFDIFTTLHANATIVIISDKIKLFAKDLHQELNSKQVTIIQTIPSQWENMLHFKFPVLKKLIFTAESLSLTQLLHIKNHQTTHYPHTEFYNLYGQTEGNSYLYYNFTHDMNHPLPIAELPLPDYVTCLDGHLYISGPSLMLGYLGDKNLDRYNTKDEIVFKDGKCYLVGRSDLQFKFKGHRVNPEYIEELINQIVVDSCIIFKKNIYAFVVVKLNNRNTKKDDYKIQIEIDIIQHLKKHLPLALIPSTFIFIDKLPLTTNGKKDRTMLKQYLSNE